jgi:hypothetical protein
MKGPLDGERARAVPFREGFGCRGDAQLSVPTAGTLLLRFPGGRRQDRLAERVFPANVGTVRRQRPYRIGERYGSDAQVVISDVYISTLRGQFQSPNFSDFQVANNWGLTRAEPATAKGVCLLG